MAHYTLTLHQILTNVEIFDFDYPMFNVDYKPTFENLFKDYFLTEEIAHETIGLFKHRLKTILNLKMPYYNKLYMSQELEQRILDNYDVTEIINRVVNGDVTKEINSDSDRAVISNNNSSASNNNKQLYKDAPKTKIDIDKFDVVTNLTKNEQSSLIESTNNDSEKLSNIAKETNEINNIENLTRTMTGNIGIQTDADAIVKYWSSLRNVTLEIFENELSELFMGVF
ncbi:hypothetical protein [Romboutsia sp.]|uniref:hypothetical protein n=1 Tax=Romboutsia sp. TaxID=1965302 RepID=UPI003F363C15